MFSKELENLIQATLEDGVLEENEKAALIKRAQNEGVDVAELEIYINSILQRRQRELNNEKQKLAEAYKKEKKEAIGPVCPNCGKQVPPMTLKCECGYEFKNKEATFSSQQLMNQIGEISASKGTNDEKNERIMNAISMFPVPNTKEDIIEFLSLALSFSIKRGNLITGTSAGRFLVPLCVILPIIIPAVIIPDYSAYDHGDPGRMSFIIIMGGLLTAVFGGFLLKESGEETILWNKRADIWQAKFSQVLLKGRTLRGDPDFQKQLDYFENQMQNS